MDAVHYRMVQQGADFDIAQCVEHPDEYAAVRAAEPGFFLTAGSDDMAAARGRAAMKFYRLAKAGWNPRIEDIYSLLNGIMTESGIGDEREGADDE